MGGLTVSLVAHETGVPVVTRFKKNKSDVDRLTAAMRQDRLVLMKTRENRRMMVRQMVGKHWSENGTTEAVVVNLISKFVSVIGRSLIAKNPRVKLSTFERSAKATADKMEAWCNREIQRLNLANSLQACVLDSLFSIGIMKVALAAPADAAGSGWGVKAGHPFCDPIDPDDFVCDTHSRDLTKLGYAGHRMRVLLDSVKDSRVYNSNRRKLEPSYHSQVNAQGDERIDVLFRSYYSSKEEYRDYVDLWEIYDPYDRKVLTLAGDDGDGNSAFIIREQEWVGPDCGPYHYLAMMKVPGNMWPKAPIQDLYDLHLLVNNIYRKLGRQAHDMKNVYVYRGGKDRDAEAVRKASDGEMVQCDSDPQVVTTEGPNQGIFVLGQHFESVFNREAGNIDLLAGAAKQSPTARQDAMLNENATRILGEMEDRSMDFFTSVTKAMMWFWQLHPT